MSDVLTPSQRRYCMSRNRGTRTAPEERLRKALWRQGFRYRIHYGLPGKPGIVFPSKKTVVFVDGCFWHGCPLHYQAPVNNAEFWQRKIGANRLRDKLVTSELEANGWLVLRIWEHEVNAGTALCAEQIAITLMTRQSQAPDG